MPMSIGMVMTSRKTNIKPQNQLRMVQPQLIQQLPVQPSLIQQQQQPSPQRLVQSTSQPPYVNRSSMNRLNLQSMRLGNSYSMDSLYNSPYRSSG